MIPSITPYLFFTGKGGVGKTSLACATAIKLADSGKKVLLISTDPASNLIDVLETEVSEEITPVNGTNNLFAVNINPEYSAEQYRQRVIAPLENLLPAAEIDKIREGLSGGCTTEIAAFDEFARYVAGDDVTNGKSDSSDDVTYLSKADSSNDLASDNEAKTSMENVDSSSEMSGSKPETSKAATTADTAKSSASSAYDVIIFDTAPTGHTLRLLELPAAWSQFIDKNPDGASCIGPSSALKMNQARYEKVVSRLRDGASTTVYLVSRPDGSALKEADRSSAELREMGLNNQILLINGYFEPIDHTDPVAISLQETSDDAIANMSANLQSLQQQTFPLRPYNLLGLPRLRSIFDPIDPAKIRDLSSKAAITAKTAKTAKAAITAITANTYADANLADFDALIDDLSKDRASGLIMTMGKGGVGKTTIAANIALELANRGFEVHLTTTDPAAHLLDTIGDREIPSTLSVDRIDPHAEKSAYIEKVMHRKGAKMDDEAQKLLREDLESPCTEEVAVFHAFSKVIHEARRKFVVVDTAPTGHTLLLLDTTGGYHKEVLRGQELDASRIKTPYMYLQDPDYARVLIVTLPETTPISEATKLEEDLERSGIKPYAWIANQCMSATEVSDPLLRLRAHEESILLEKLKTRQNKKLFSIPWRAQKSEIVSKV